MKIIDPRLFQAGTFQDFLFRIRFDENENGRERNKNRHELFSGTTFQEHADALQAGFVAPDQNYILGMDDSHWGGILDFANTHERGMRFCILKCMDGTIPTKYWAINRPKAISSGLFVGEYAWLYPDKKIKCRDQARALWNLIKNEPRQLPVTIDHEWTRFAGAPANPTWDDLDLWVTEFIRLSGYKPMYYGAAGYANMFGPMPAALKNKFSAFWFANYGVAKPTLPKGFTRWGFWQFTDSLDQNFYAPSSTGKKELDGNYWHGTMEQLMILAGMDSAPIPPTPSGPAKTLHITLKHEEQVLLDVDIPLD